MRVWAIVLALGCVLAITVSAARADPIRSGVALSASDGIGTMSQPGSESAVLGSSALERSATFARHGSGASVFETESEDHDGPDRGPSANRGPSGNSGPDGDDDSEDGDHDRGGLNSGRGSLTSGPGGPNSGPGGGGGLGEDDPGETTRNPEPATFLLLGTGLAGLVRWRLKTP